MLDETKPDVILFLGSDHVETFSVTCVPTFAIIAGSRAIARFAGREHNLPIHREMAEDILNKLVVEHDFDMAYSEDAELGHAFAVPFEYVIGKRDIPVIPVLHQRLRAAAADAEAVRGARQGDCRRSSRDARSASRSSRAAACRTSRARRKYLHPEFDFDRWLVVAVRSRQHRRAAEHDRHAARRGRQHRDAQLGHDVRRDRCAAGRADRLHPDLASRSLHDAVPAGRARAGTQRRRRSRSRSAASSSRNRASSSTSIRRPKRTASTSCCSKSATARSCAGASSTISTRRQRIPAAAASSATAAEELINVGKGGLVSEHVGPLVEAGAHPLQALMSLHVIFSTSHARGQQAMAGSKH